MASKTHLRRVRAARRRLAAQMRAAGLDPLSHADHMKRLAALRERIAPNRRFVEKNLARRSPQGGAV